MARRRKSSALDDGIDLVSMMPWWVGVALAAISYVVLHSMAVPEPVVAVKPGQMGQILSQTLVASFAAIGQYIVPGACLVGAAMSAFARKKRSALVKDVDQAKSADALNGMSWREFEMLVGEAYRLQGYRVTETGGGGPDGGVDLVLTKENEKFLVQCKQWKAFKVGVAVVRELYGVMAVKGASGGFVVTSGRFTEDAKAFAEGLNVQLVDGPKLLAMIQQAKLSIGDTSQQPASKLHTEPHKSAKAPTCPKCSSAMVKRTARKGSNVGGEFWGCTEYPSCNGIRQMD